MKSIRSAVLMVCMAPAESETASSGPAPASPKGPELKNSHWCVHAKHGLGMIGELGAQASFHRFYTKPGEDEATLDSTPVYCDAGDLTLCTPEQLPAHLGYTAQQLTDMGYDR